MRLPEEIFSTPHGRYFVMRMQTLSSDSNEPAVLEEKLKVLRILESEQWRKYLPKSNKEVERIYFVLETVQQLVKIGDTANIDALFSGLRTANVNPLKILAVVPGGQKLEHQLHKRLSHLRVRGEWFKDCAELTKVIKKIKGGAV